MKLAKTCVTCQAEIQGHVKAKRTGKYTNEWDFSGYVNGTSVQELVKNVASEKSQICLGRAELPRHLLSVPFEVVKARGRPLWPAKKSIINQINSLHRSWPLTWTTREQGGQQNNTTL